VPEAVKGGLVVPKLAPGKVALEQPGFEVARVLGQQLVAEVVREAPAPLFERAQDLGTEGRDERIVLLRLIFPANHLTQDRGHHVQLPI
jgi:hypothetical protein